MKRLLLLAPWALVLAACGPAGPAGSYSFDALSPAAQNALPGADKITLKLTPDGKVSLDAGSMNLLDTNWTAQGDKVTFSKGQGLVGAEYRLTPEGLIPQKDGKDITEWRFKKK